MMDFLEVVKGTPGFIALVLAGPLSVLIALGRLRDGAVRLSEKKQKALRDLLRDRTWQKQPALLLQLSLRQAFGKSLDERDFDFIQTRHDPMTLLSTRLAAGDFVRLRADGNGYDDNRKKHQLRWLSMNQLSWFFIMLGALVFMPLVFLVAMAWQTGPIEFALSLLEALGFVWLCIYSAAKAEAAGRLLSLEERHPALAGPESNAANHAPKPNAPKPSRRRVTSRTSNAVQSMSDVGQMPSTTTPPSGVM